MTGCTSRLRAARPPLASFSVRPHYARHHRPRRDRRLGRPAQAKRAGIPHVVGWSPEPGERAAAAQEEALDDAPPRRVHVARAADLLILAAPPANLQLLEDLHDQIGPGVVVTDVGSVKRQIVTRAEALGVGSRF